MKILFIHGDQREPGQGGGAESLLRDQAEGLKRLGHECAWWYGEGSLEDAIDDFRPDICHVMTIHCYPMGLQPLIYLQQMEISHLIHVQDYWPFCASRMMIYRGRPCSGAQECKHECGERISYLPIVNKSFVVAGNAYTAEIYRNNELRCDAVIELGVDKQLFYPPDRDFSKAPLICTTCAWPQGNWKGMDILEQSLEGTDHVVTLITGKTRSEVAEALKLAQIYVFPSIYEETFGLGLCEAMMSGCACVAFDVAGAKAQIENGVTGLLVPKGDHFALREAIERVYHDPGLRYRLGMEASNHALQEHTLEAMARRWLNVYQEVLCH